ncbi:MAG TPA: ABC transporter permease [Streptosporangiaceae bacterium]|nr:ABC transporter permease [Streptosporangiaceae bacterium]
MLPDTAAGIAGPPARSAAPADPGGAARAGALIRHNTILLLRDPGALASRMILPLAFLILLHPLYEAAQGHRGGVTQAVIATVVTFSLLALSIVGGSILTDRIWHTWERVRMTAARPAEVLAGKVIPALGVLLLQQGLIIGFGAALGLRLAAPRPLGLALLGLATLAWSATLLGLGALIGVLARSMSELSAAYDIGAMILSSLGGALVPLTAMPSWVRDIAPASPGYWAVTALQAALRGDAGRTLTAAAALAGFAAGAALLAAMRTSRTGGRSGRL